MSSSGPQAVYQICSKCQPAEPIQQLRPSSARMLEEAEALLTDNSASISLCSEAVTIEEVEAGLQVPILPSSVPGSQRPASKRSIRHDLALLDSKLEPLGFEKSGDTLGDGDCLIHG